MKPVKERTPSKGKTPRQRLTFHEVWLNVKGLGNFSFERLSDGEQEAIRKSKWEAARRLALKNTGYNRSRAKSAHQTFDQGQFALRAWKHLPAIQREIHEAVDRNDLDYFINLGKALAKLKKQPADQVLHGDSLGHFLVTNWIDRPGSACVPPFCMLTHQVLVEVCQACVASGHALTSGKIALAIYRLGLKQASKFRVGYCGYVDYGGGGKMLVLGETPGPLKTQEAVIVC